MSYCVCRCRYGWSKVSAGHKLGLRKHKLGLAKALGEGTANDAVESTAKARILREGFWLPHAPRSASSPIRDLRASGPRGAAPVTPTPSKKPRTQ